jgi:hypothetical protein
MKANNQNSRRKFLGALAMGAAASGLSILSSPLQANSLQFDEEKLNESDKWFKKIKGSHRIVYDGSTPHDGFPIIWNWAFLLTNNQTGTPDEDMTAMTVIRHKAIPYAFEDRLWEKYALGEFFGLNDNSTGKPSVRNLVYEPKDGDFPLPGIDGIKRLQERGSMFCACDLATKVYSGFVAQKMNLDPTEVYNDWVSGVLPDIQLVPSGVWALGRAQEHGCGYIFAG